MASVTLPCEAFESGEKRDGFFEQLAAGLLTRPEVHAIAAGTSPPLTSGAPATIILNERAAQDLFGSPALAIGRRLRLARTLA